MIRRILGSIKGRAVLAWTARRLFGFGGSLAFSLCGSFHPRRLYRAVYARLPFFLRWCDWAGVNEIFLCHEYALAQDCLDGLDRPVVLDIGANIGAFSLYIFSLKPSARIHAYEAGTETAAVLWRNREINPALDWTIIHAAAWSKDGFVSFETKEFSTGSRVHEGGQESVPSVSLATLLGRVGEAVDLMKIDIEGAEEAVLSGQSLLQVKNLIIELHPGRCNTDAVVSTLRQNFPQIYSIPGRQSTKPLLLATHKTFDLPLFTG